MIEKHPEDSPSDAFETMVSEFALQIRQGESPNIEDYANRNAALASRVLRLFPVLELMERNGEQSDEWSELDLLDAEKRYQVSIQEEWEAPSRIGDYRLIREIGRGGMGIVFEAEQESLGRRVAIKILPTSAQFDSRRNERFATEAKASGMLHHTNIVPVFGVGREDGLSFFVMQYINGQPVSLVLRDVARIRELSTKPFDHENDSTFSTEKIVQSMMSGNNHRQVVPTNEQSLLNDEFPPTRNSGSETDSLLGNDSGDAKGTKSRNYFRNVARIGMKVSEALAHAHSHGILHRDIKPSNLILDSEGAVWVTDFGLAKYFDSPDITKTGEVVGTLRYMSPEQLGGKATPRSDIFGLGLTLYEMLTLQPAYQGVDKKRLLEKVANATPVSPRAIDSRIPKDLETIVMKCIHAEPAKRYVSAEAVGQDLSRFLDGQPIRARRISTIEKSWKWCCRRPALASAFAALTLSIILGVAGVAWQWNKTLAALEKSEANFLKSQEHFSQARSAVVQITESISREELLKTPDLLPVRRKLLLKALDYQINFANNYSDKVDVQIELAEACLKLGYATIELAKYEEANEHLNHAKSILEPLSEQELSEQQREDVIICLAEAASLNSTIGLLHGVAIEDELLQSVRMLLDDREETELSNPELVKLAEIYGRMGDAADSKNAARNRAIESSSKSAFDYYSKAYTLVKQATNDKNLNTAHAKVLADAHLDLGIANRRLGNKEAAADHYTAAVDQYRKLVELEPDNTTFRFGLAESLGSLAFYYGFTEHEQEMGVSIYSEAINEYRKLSLEYPSVLKFTLGEARAFLNSGTLAEDEEKFEQAHGFRQSAVKLNQRALLFAPNDSRMLSNYGKALMGLGLNHARRGNELMALDFFNQSREQHELAVVNSPQNLAYQIRLSRSILNIADSHKELGNYEDAYECYIDATKHVDENSETFYLTGRELLGLAVDIKVDLSDPDAGDIEIAEKAIATAKQVFQKLVDPELDTLNRIHSDHRFDRIATSAIGASFLEWFEAAKNEFAETAH